MTYLAGYAEYSSKLSPDTQIDATDFTSELILYFEKKKYELWYCIHNEKIAEETMTYDPWLKDLCDFTLAEYAVQKINWISDIVGDVINALEKNKYVTRQELVVLLESILTTRGKVINVEILNADNATFLMNEEDFPKDQSFFEDEDDLPAPEIEDLLEYMESPEYEQEIEQTEAIIDMVKTSPFPSFRYGVGDDGLKAHADTLLDSADEIYKMFTEMVYSQEEYQGDNQGLQDKMRRWMQANSTSATKSYLHRIIAKNFLEHREPIVKGDVDFGELDTQVHHNNYYNVKMDILYDLFRAQYSVENEFLPEKEFLTKGVYMFTKYEARIDDDKKQYWQKNHDDAGWALYEKFDTIPLYEDMITPKVQYCADTAGDKIKAANDNRNKE